MDDVNDLHEHLKNLIEKSWLKFNYSILWECSSQRRVLRFKDGYHRGIGKAQEVRIMGSCVTVTEDATDGDFLSELLFKISKDQSFDINEDLLGHALIVSTAVWINAEYNVVVDPSYKWGMWKRTKYAHQFGIRTLICLPLEDNKVLELASTRMIPTNIPWMLHHVHLIHHIGTLTRQQQQLLLALQRRQQQQLRHYAVKQQVLRQSDEHQLLGLRGELKEGAVNEMKNRGKEKISDSKCSSWTILTDSSDRSTDRTFSCSHDYSGPS